MDAKEFIDRAVAQLTDNQATVTVKEDQHGAIFEIFSTNNALLIGKHHVTIDSLRVIAKALGFKGKYRIKVILRERQYVSPKEA